MIHVYNGPGVARTSFEALYALSVSIFGKASTSSISPQCIRRGEWVDKTALLIVPGGRDIPYLKALGVQGAKNIHDFVKCGGKYVGVCAGAYFASSSIEFEMGTPYEVYGKRPLGFFQGIAKGTLFEKPFSYEAFDHISAPSIRIHDEVIPLFYGGGCFFEGSSTPHDKVLGYYQKGGQPAIIETKYGEGKSLLSGVHFEYAPSFLEKMPLSTDVVSALIEHDRQRTDLAQNLLKGLMNN